MPPQIITLTTDFGLKDPYAAQLKAVILTLCPKATIVDTTHQIEKFNIRNGAYTLSCAAPYFPQGTIHVAVVDPGVGTQRRPIIIQTKKGFFVGPDNGLLLLAAKPQTIIAAHQITNPKFTLPHVCSTFHGRDIFAPAAAHLANGVAIDTFGEKIAIDELETPTFASVAVQETRVMGEVLHVDGFGNVITNVYPVDVKSLNVDLFAVELPCAQLKLGFSKTYGDVEPKQPLLLVGSHGYLEIALNQGSTADKLQIRVGDKIVFSVV
ncbi:MAG: S-adenosyl-l-methionine hydroxide adenosyltransferase family protein [Candidatus Bathyarchaeota archaeon]|nr:S-adenosyl-l-methionine hydroxide adenosyltransferase family protein [Candidatus Bathyarchaeota archaeon]